MANIWFSSDLHLHHANIRTYCPWRQEWSTDIDHMNEVLIKAWNDVVMFDDIVFCLGDFSLSDEATVTATRRRLNGHIKLALGNHDRTATSMRRCGFEVEHHWKLAHNGVNIAMTHDPKRFKPDEIEWAGLLLHGHWHGDDHHDHSLPFVSKCYDCGVDATRSLAPLHIDEILQRHTDRIVYASRKSAGKDSSRKE